MHWIARGLASAFFLAWLALFNARALPVTRKFEQPFFPDRELTEDVFRKGPKSRPRPPPSPGKVEELPGYGKLSESSFAGYLPVNESCGSYLYFWLVESQRDPRHDPVVIWLNGGPGSSSFLGAMMENGRYLVTQDGSVIENRYAWNSFATYVMIDQPAGVGFSLVEDRACYVPDENTAMNQLHKGVLKLFELLPQYAGLPLYVFGESYGGHYVPELAVRLLQAGDVNLAGIGIGDGWVDPKTMQQSYSEFAYTHGLLSPGIGRDHTDSLQIQCLAMYNKVDHNATASPDDWRALDKFCNGIEAYIVKQAGQSGVNVYDVRDFHKNYDYDPISLYLNRRSTREALNVDPRVVKWSDTSDTIAYLLEAQEQLSTVHLMPYILKRTHVLIYNGVFDMDCNYLATDRWLFDMEWSGAKSYRSMQRAPWLLDGNVAGAALHVQNLTQLIMEGAGHFVPMNQAKAALAMLNTFMSGLSFVRPQGSDHYQILLM